MPFQTKMTTESAASITSNSTRLPISLVVDENHPAYQWAKKQSDSVNAFGHIGTHIDCYTKVPQYSHYTTGTIVVDCTQTMPSIDTIEKLDIAGKSLVLFTANLEKNSYGTPEYGKADTTLDSDVLDAILDKRPAFIVIDSYGIGAHGDEHISFDKRCEDNDCFVIENVVLNQQTASNLTQLDIQFDVTGASTGKRCEVTAVLSNMEQQ
ncbi:cyclase family protein [Photobacterium rosenbergii]|nr:cyclase family protein [Photobacterium rosenbergii]